MIEHILIGVYVNLFLTYFIVLIWAGVVMYAVIKLLYDEIEYRKTERIKSEYLKRMSQGYVDMVKESRKGGK